MSALLAGHDRFFVKQRKEWVEIFTDFETKNQYVITDAQGVAIGTVAEKAGGLLNHLLRAMLRSHRSLEAGVYDGAGARVFTLLRPFFFLFSTLTVIAEGGRTLGRVERRFGILFRKYDLVDAGGRVFATIRAPLWRLWTFPILKADGSEAGAISKKWGGGLREIFTDADSFMVDLGRANFTEEQKAVAFAAALSIDFDFFEENSASHGLLGSGG